MRLLTAIPRRREGWLEAILLPAVALLITHFLVPWDPLLLHQPFPWLVLVPLLIALRYEFLPGALATLVLTTASWWHPYPTDVLLPAAAGTLLVTLIGAEYASAWRRQETRRALQEEITTTRLSQLADDLYVTRTSLDRLEQSLLYQPVSVRSALRELRDDLRRRQGVLDPPLLRKILYFLNQLVGVQVAAWFSWEAKEPRPRQLAALGRVSEWDGGDPVARAALSEGRSQQLMDLKLERLHHYLSVHVHGEEGHSRDLLCIEDMSFFAINRESMKIIEVFFQYLCRYRNACIRARELLSRWPDCPVDFASDLLQLQSLATIAPEVGICQRYLFHTGWEAREIVRWIENLRRDLDMIWIHEEGEYLSALILLPFAGPVAAEGQRTRVEVEMQKHCANHWEAAFVRADFLPVDTRPAAEQIAHWLEWRL